MAAIKIFTKKDSTRLRYVLDWAFKQVFHITYELENDEAALVDEPFFIAYGASFPNAISIPDSGLLWQETIQPHEISCGSWCQIPTLYHQAACDTTLPFDCFSAIFFLISRYEEYYPFKADKYGRYPAKESILYKNNWLQRPLIDEWLYELYTILKEKGVPVFLSAYKYTPTYDIDMAYSYKHKGIRRNIGGFLRSILRGDTNEIRRRHQVLLSKALDPYDSFVAIKRLHTNYHLRPFYFILSALKTTEYDKNISPKNNVMQRLIKRLQQDGTIGLHPSFFSDIAKVFKEEHSILRQITNEPVTHSRQHYIKLTLPATYRHLIAHGIHHDYSMGYGSHLGFRCGTGRSFYWYDLAAESPSGLHIHPFCFMDTTAHFEEKLSIKETFMAYSKMQRYLQNTQSQLVTVFHNFSLGTDPEWAGWARLYEEMIQFSTPEFTKIICVTDKEYEEA